MLLRGISLLTVSLKSCRGEPVLKKGGGCCAPVGGVCLSQRLGVDIKKKRSVSMLHRGDTAHFEGTDSQIELVPGTYSSDRGHTDGQRNTAVGINLSAGARNFGI